VKPRILFLVLADYEALSRKGIASMIRERDEGGFFERVVTVHPLASRRRVIELDAVHVVQEFGFGRYVRWPGAALRLPLLPLAFTLLVWRIARIVKRERIDLVRATDPYLMGLLAWIVAGAVRVPFCVSIHADHAKRFALNTGRGWGRMLRRIAACLPPLVLPRAARVMPIRDSLVKQARAAGVRDEAIRIIPHGIDVGVVGAAPSIDVRRLFDVHDAAPLLSFVGRTSSDNYVDEVLDAAERLAGVRSGFVLLVVGGGDDETRVRNRVAGSSTLRRHVRLTGFQPREVALAVRRASAVGLCLMGGFSLIEACAAGIPVIAYDVEWHAELVEDGVTGFLVGEHDVETVVKRLGFLLDNPREGAAMGRRGRERALGVHDIAVTSEIKRRCYAEMLALAPRRHAPAALAGQ